MSVPTFTPKKLINLSEFSIKEKEKYYQLLIKFNSRFRPAADGRFVCNIRFLAPNVQKSDFIQQSPSKPLFSFFYSSLHINSH